MFAYDKAPIESHRKIDDNGFLHVDIANVTKEQVAPYKGDEIPDYERLGFKADEIYKAYRPAEELEKPETINSLNGIPILLNHHLDTADNPQKQHRIGSTGTDASFDRPYLRNSLHIQDADAIKRINDGSMKELSLCYRYTPVKKSGEFKGEHYDFLMTDISCNHLALVDEGRAGADCYVSDSKPEEVKMDEKQQAEQALLDTAKQTLETVQQLNDSQDKDNAPITEQENASDNQGVKPMEEEKKETACDGKEEILKEILEVVSQAGIDPDKFKEKLDLYFSATDEEPEKEDLTKAEDEEDPDFKQGFADGVKYGEEKEKEEPKKLDSEHESEGMEKALGKDEDKEDEGKLAADSVNRIVKAVKEQLSAQFLAADECKRSLGNIKATAFDSADAIYLAALKAEGVNVKGMKASEARTAYRVLTQSRAKNSVAMDSKTVEDSPIANILNGIKVGV